VEDASSTAGTRGATELDVVVIGAGFSGLYMLHKLREGGFSAAAFEMGENVGGTWYWNRYPGARCDIQSIEYSFSFDERIQQEWVWSELMPAQAEVEAYLNFVCDRLDLRSTIRFSTKVTAATYEETSATWTVETDRGDRVRARFVIAATGCLSADSGEKARCVGQMKEAQEDVHIRRRDRAASCETGSYRVRPHIGFVRCRDTDVHVRRHRYVHVEGTQRPVQDVRTLHHLVAAFCEEHEQRWICQRAELNLHGGSVVPVQCLHLVQLVFTNRSVHTQPHCLSQRRVGTGVHRVATAYRRRKGSHVWVEAIVRGNRLRVFPRVPGFETMGKGKICNGHRRALPLTNLHGRGDRPRGVMWCKVTARG